MAEDTLYGVMTLFQTSFDSVPSGAGRMDYFKSWIDKSADLGAQIIRLPGDWRMLEENGNNAWNQWYVDETIELIQYAGNKGIKVIYEFAQTPDWAKEYGSNNVWTYPANVQQFGQAAAYLHQKFIQAGVDDNVVAWEIWNEPNVSAFWPDSGYRNPQGAGDGTDISVNKAACLEYVALLNAAFDALKAVDSNVTVLGGSLAGTDFEYAQWMLQAGAKFDGMSVHPYTRPFEANDPTPATPTNDPTDDPEVGNQSQTLNERWSFEYGIEKIHDMLVAAGKPDGIWLTEMGWRLPHNSSWTYVPNEQAQANYMQSALELIQGWDFLKAVTVFSLYDAGDGDFGLLRPNGTWRPVAHVLHDFIANLDTSGGGGGSGGGGTGSTGTGGPLDGTAGGDVLIGGAWVSNQIQGLGGNDYIEAGRVADQIDAGAGDDVIVTQGGEHVINGGDGEDTLAILGRAATFSISETAEGLVIGREGFATTLSNVEWVVFDTKAGLFGIDVAEMLGHAKDIKGSDLDDLVSGSSTDEFLYGLEGADQIDGKGGSDIMFGGGGNDTYIVDSVHDMVVEAANGGTDTILSSISTSIQSLEHVENVTLTGSARAAIGNGGDNELTGNGRANRLVGGAGDDVLTGGGGRDRLVGGEGADVFVFSGNSGRDCIRDFAEGEDRIDLSAYGDIKDMADLLGNHLWIDGSRAVIALGGRHTITVSQCWSENSFSESDFIFA